jgi:hypothetical protein
MCRIKCASFAYKNNKYFLMPSKTAHFSKYALNSLGFFPMRFGESSSFRPPPQTNQMSPALYSRRNTESRFVSAVGSYYVCCKLSLYEFALFIYIQRRSYWPPGLRHELSSLARTLGSWVRTPLKAWMCLCAFILCLRCSVCRYWPCDGLIPRPRSPTGYVYD